MFTLLNVGVIAVAVYGFIVTGKSKCSGSENGYGPVLGFMNGVGIAFAILELLFTAYLFFSFNSSKKLPIFGGEFDASGN